MALNARAIWIFHTPFNCTPAVVRNFALRKVTEETHPAPYVKLALDMAF